MGWLALSSQWLCVYLLILMQVDLPHYDIGDAVRVVDDLAELHRMQSNIGDWNDDMALVGT